jgi:DNA-binding NarL/FixJ family response regulator
MTLRRCASLGGALVVAVIAALASYSHMRAAALAYGQSELIADLLPISVDGMMATARQRPTQDLAHPAQTPAANRQVAGQLFLSTKTVAAHLTSIYAKLGVHSRTELARPRTSSICCWRVFGRDRALTCGT